MPEISCTDFSFPLLTRSQAFGLLRLLEFRHVDLGVFERNDHAQTSAMMEAPAQFLRVLSEDLKRAELGVSDVFLQIGSHPADASTNDADSNVRMRNREVFHRALELCSALHCPHMTGLPGVPHGDPARDFDLAAAETQWRVGLCGAAGVSYAIEPHLGSVCTEVASTRKLLNAVPGLTLTLDYGHFLAADIGCDEVHALLPDASHLHLRGGAPGRLQTSFDENTIDFEEIIRRLNARNYAGVLALEYVWIDWQGCNRSDTLSETFKLRGAIRAMTNAREWKAGRNV